MKQGTCFSTYKWLIAFIVFLSFPFSAFAASLISVSSAGADIFEIKATNMEDVAAIDLILYYDATTLSNPRFTEGPLISGAMTAVNPNVSGFVRIAIIRTNPVNGTGTIATLKFDLIGNSPGKINSMSAKLSNFNGTPLAAQVVVTNPSDLSANKGFSQEANPTDKAEIKDLPEKAQQVAPAIIVDQTDKTGRDITEPELAASIELEDKSVITDIASEQDKETTIPSKKSDLDDKSVETAKDAKVAERKIQSQKSILERFKKFRGKRTAENFISLFNREDMSDSVQEPPIAFSDGKSIVKAMFTADPGQINQSDITMVGTKLVSLYRASIGMNIWNIELIPERGVYNASFTLSQGRARTLNPLTIVPKINIKKPKAKSVSQADFRRYLNAKKADLNGDGKRDYVDDYIFTANYLVSINRVK